MAPRTTARPMPRRRASLCRPTYRRTVAVARVSPRPEQCLQRVWTLTRSEGQAIPLVDAAVAHAAIGRFPAAPTSAKTSVQTIDDGRAMDSVSDSHLQALAEGIGTRLRAARQ